MIDDVRKNQLIHFQDIKLLNNFDLKEVNKVPAYTDHSLPIAERGRAYLDINCAHCHTKGGMAEDQWINLNYETPISETGILWSKSYFLYQVASGEMPYIGTSEVDQKGLQILREFMESL
jgi:mono/diheme cytochrome c family protein